MERLGQTIGQYTVRKVLGEGHFGTVYLAEGDIPGKGPRSSRHKRVAIKQLRGEWTMRGFETLVREFELLDRVKHRSLCRVYEFLDRENAVVMEYVSGATLRQVLDAFTASKEALWPDAVLEIGCEIADCLFQAHATPDVSGQALLLVHRDIKPENIMLTPTGEVKVLDFGLARIEDGAREVGVKGTPLYMAPEQARGDPIDHRTDLFGLGLVLFELLTGTAAYPVPSRDRDSVIDALMGRIERAELARELARLTQDFPAIGAVLSRTLAPSPGDRPSDGHGLMLELKRCIQQRGALAEFAAYAFGPLGPLAGHHVEPEREQGPISLPPVRAAQPRSLSPQRTIPRVNSPPPTDMLSPPSEAPELSMSKPPESPPASQRPSGTPRLTAAARPRPTLKPPSKPTPPKMWTPGAEGQSSAGKPPAPPPGKDLQMVPLHQDEDLNELSKPNATAFFNVPTPPRKKEEISDLKRVDPIAIASGAPVSPVAPPPGVVPGGYAPGYVPPGAVPPSPLIPAAPIGIQGPIAQGPYGAPPPAQLPPNFNQDVERARSYRVFAVVAGLMFMVFSVTIVAVLLLASVVLFPGMTGGDKTASNTPTPIIQPPSDRGRRVDTGYVPPPPPPPPPEPVKPRPTGPKPPSEPKPPPPPKPSTAPGTVTITLAPGSPPFSAIEVVCAAEGFRQRAPFSNGVASLPGVPRSDCTLFFKGAGPAKIQVRGGQSLTCSFEGSGPNCK